MTNTYKPINCEFHDELEAASTLHKTVRIIYTDSDGTQKTMHGKIQDLGIVTFEDSKAEYMTMDNGLKIRLDAIISIDEIARPQE
jgi:Rho-binding antiterminator